MSCETTSLKLSIHFSFSGSRAGIPHSNLYKLSPVSLTLFTISLINGNATSFRPFSWGNTKVLRKPSLVQWLECGMVCEMFDVCVEFLALFLDSVFKMFTYTVYLDHVILSTYSLRVQNPLQCLARTSKGLYNSCREILWNLKKRMLENIVNSF